MAQNFVLFSGRGLQSRPGSSARHKCSVHVFIRVRRAILQYPVIINRLSIAECLAISMEMTLLRVLMYALVSEPTQAYEIRQKSRG
jgi:hypothetical protein